MRAHRGSLRERGGCIPRHQRSAALPTARMQQRTQGFVCAATQGRDMKPGQEAALLEVEHLTKQYRNVLALNDVSFHITNGITGILGENGAGKSTAIKILLGLLKPTSGKAMVLGENAAESVMARSR